MCGRVIADYDELIQHASGTVLEPWMVRKPAEAVSSWNIKPTQQLPIVFTSREDGSKHFETAFWSLIPRWAEELRPRYATFNARIESVHDRATFKAPIKNQRAIIPVTGFYEWTGEKGSRVPHAIFGPAAILPMAGMYTYWADPDVPGAEGRHLTATILTMESAGTMESLHSRMPVFVPPELTEDWLNPEVPGDDMLLSAVQATSVPFAEQLFEYQVDPLRGNGPGLIKPRQQAGLDFSS